MVTLVVTNQSSVASEPYGSDGESTRVPGTRAGTETKGDGANADWADNAKPAPRRDTFKIKLKQIIDAVKAVCRLTSSG